MTQATPEIARAVARWLVTLGAAWAMNHGLTVSGSDTEIVTGGLVALVTLCWAAIEHWLLARQSAVKVETALAMPKGTTVEQLNDKLKGSAQ